MAESKYFHSFRDLKEELSPGVRMCPFDGDRMTVSLMSVAPLTKGKGEDPHAHENEQINIYFEGKMNMMVDGQHQEVGPGWLVIVPPGVVHTGDVMEPTIQINYSSPPRGKGYVQYMKDITHTEDEE